jgi:hypothetical protein
LVSRIEVTSIEAGVGMARASIWTEFIFASREKSADFFRAYATNTGQMPKDSASVVKLRVQTGIASAGQLTNNRRTYAFLTEIIGFIFGSRSRLRWLSSISNARSPQSRTISLNNQ